MSKMLKVLGQQQSSRGAALHTANEGASPERLTLIKYWGKEENAELSGFSERVIVTT